MRHNSPSFFILSDNALAGIPRNKIVQQLAEVGFDEELQRQLVGSLSGGWKMRLELARAMLYNADLLLLDEPTNHVSNSLSFHYLYFLNLLSPRF